MNDIKKAIDILNTYWDSLIDTGLIDCETLCQCVNVLEEKLNGGWIPVKERLPESEDNSVLAQFNNGSIETVHIQDYFDDITAGYDENGNQLYTKWYIYQGVVAWQPLPEEYEEAK